VISATRETPVKVIKILIGKCENVFEDISSGTYDILYSEKEDLHAQSNLLFLEYGDKKYIVISLTFKFLFYNLLSMSTARYFSCAGLEEPGAGLGEPGRSLGGPGTGLGEPGAESCSWGFALSTGGSCC